MPDSRPIEQWDKNIPIPKDMSAAVRRMDRAGLEKCFLKYLKLAQSNHPKKDWYMYSLLRCRELMDRVDYHEALLRYKPKYMQLKAELEVLLMDFYHNYTTGGKFPVTLLNKITLWEGVTKRDGCREFIYHPYVTKLWEILPRFNKVSDHLDWNAEQARPRSSKPLNKYPWLAASDNYELLILLITLLTPPTHFRDEHLHKLIPN